MFSRWTWACIPPAGTTLRRVSDWLHTCSMQRIPRLSIPAAPLTRASSSPARRVGLQSSPLSPHKAVTSCPQGRALHDLHSLPIHQRL